MTMVSLRLFVSRFATHALAAAIPIVACGGNHAFGIGPGGTAGGDHGGLLGGSGVGSSSGTSGSGTGSSSGTAGGSGTAGNSGPGATSTCVAGTQGCLCDSTGGCAPGLTCTPQGAPQPSMCCGGSGCTPATGNIGATCGAATSAASCGTPGITIPPASGGNDNCGYPASSFVESTTICTINAVGGGAQPAVIQVFYNDEHALTLGCETSTYPVSPLTSDPGSASYPETGDPACVDAVGRPLRPVLYVTDTTADPNCTAGDLQQNGQPYDPVAVFGTWKSATEGTGNVGTPAKVDPTGNKWNLGSGADALPTAAVPIAGTPAPGMPAAGMPGGGMPPPSMACGEAYGAELRFEVGLISGHSYRFQVILHDGDQNKGGDSGEACAVYCAGGPVCAQGVQTCGTGPGTEGSFCPEGTKCINYCCLGPPNTTSPPPSSGSPDSGPIQ